MAWKKTKKKKESPVTEWLRIKREEEWKRLSELWRKNEGGNRKGDR